MIYKTYILTSGEVVNHTFPNDRLFNQSTPPPAWFVWTFHDFLGNILAYDFTAQGIGSYSIPFTEFVGGEVVDMEIIINVVADTQSLYQNCCSDRDMNLAWLNDKGGWQNYIFQGIRTFEVRVGDDSTFKTSDLVLKFSEIKDVYTGEIVTSGDIPKAHADALDSLRTSIQAFLFNEQTTAWDIPIMVDKGSFTKYKTSDKFFQVAVKFIYAEEVLIQTQ